MRQFGDRLAVLNRTGEPRTVRLRYPERVGVGGLIEFGRFEVIPVPGSGMDAKGIIELPLNAYELRVLGRR